MPATSNLGYSTQQYQLQPQFDWGSLVGPIVTSVLGALSNSPQLNQMIQLQAAAPMLQPQSTAITYGQLQPQINLGTLIGPIITSVLGALSSSPQITQSLQPQAAGNNYNQLQPQVNLAALIGPIVTSVLAALSNSPQLAQSLQPQAAGPALQTQSNGVSAYGQLQPQFDFGSLAGPIVTSVLGALSNSPQLAQSAQAHQSAGAQIFH